jgi:putative Mg2+ transporter-C (MgtC) family protein
MNLGQEAEFIAVVAFAMLLGGVIGTERELADKPAGLRTHALVAGAAALLVGLVDILAGSYVGTGNNIQADPIRVIEAIVTGISFIGAGTIFRRSAGDSVEGLTTAASLLTVAAVGIAVALKEHVIALGVTLLALFVLYFLKHLELWLNRRFHRRS